MRNGRLFERDAASLPGLAGLLSASTRVFQLPQAGHFPAHFGNSFPHSLQKKTVLDLAI
jgi:hypothetical protein